jgi:hypothetical protein
MFQRFAQPSTSYTLTLRCYLVDVPGPPPLTCCAQYMSLARWGFKRLEEPTPIGWATPGGKVPIEMQL